MQEESTSSLEAAWRDVTARAEAAAGGRPLHVLAVGKTRPAAELRAMAALGQRAFGENYVQEARAKQLALADLGLEWHLIGPLQSNKCGDVARRFDWLQTLDRAKLVPLLAQARPPTGPTLEVLVQVNIDDEASKSGCRPRDIGSLADTVAATTRLRLRGLMAIPAPHPDRALRQRAFARMRHAFDALRLDHPGIDTLSMGMSDDFELAIREGATMVRIGSQLFGPRHAR
ncbi:MAG: YggS family pyridoxal phosphate-dependent enzyme [Xanthomonadales bacterium]|nr:YggS family pyridoxal phosphate-dependent enzyme [Xanthomonadales bacterium]